jgi:hypothetical protein
MDSDPFDPIRWGIDPATAGEIGRFDRPGAKRILTGRFGEVCPPPAVSDRVPGIAQMAREIDSGRWFWETTPPDPVFRRIDRDSNLRVDA